MKKSALIIALIAAALTSTIVYAANNCDSGLAIFAMFCKDPTASVSYVIPFGAGNTENVNFVQTYYNFDERDTTLVIAESKERNEIFVGIGNTSIRNYNELNFDKITYWSDPNIDIYSVDQLVLQIAAEIKSLNPDVTIKAKVFDHDMPLP